MDKEIKNPNIKSNIKLVTRNMKQTNENIKPSQGSIKKEFILDGLG
jgi:hypothetical protein